MLADLILQDAGRGGLWEWAMEERRTARPPNWDKLARRLELETAGKVAVSGEVLRKWVIAAEDERTKGASK